jgi:hypothetical protein
MGLEAGHVLTIGAVEGHVPLHVRSKNPLRNEILCCS